MTVPNKIPPGWPLYVIQDLIGYLQSERYLRTAELLTDAAFVFAEEHKGKGEEAGIGAGQKIVDFNKQRMN